MIVLNLNKQWNNHENARTDAVCVRRVCAVHITGTELALLTYSAATPYIIIIYVVI